MTPDELRALLGEATAGPWDYRYEMVDELHGSALGNVLTRGDRGNYWMGKPDSDGPLIVALRNHAEALLELWEASGPFTGCWRRRAYLAQRSNDEPYRDDLIAACGKCSGCKLHDALDRLEAT